MGGRRAAASAGITGVRGISLCFHPALRAIPLDFPFPESQCEIQIAKSQIRRYRRIGKTHKTGSEDDLTAPKFIGDDLEFSF